MRNESKRVAFYADENTEARIENIIISLDLDSKSEAIRAAIKYLSDLSVGKLFVKKDGKMIPWNLYE